ncbi:MAG: EFR1 family ferrodoxin [Lachnospiraceae bacterium]|nr:EFR1 family ferrodoxin [Lachnospiraceae bacterium]
MKIKRIWKVYFSPTGGTKKAAGILADCIAEELSVPIDNFDYTLPEAREGLKQFEPGDLVIWATPVYAGRIPNKTLKYIQNSFQGNGALAVPVAVFGNRSYDDALSELRNELEKNAFHTIAGAAIVVRHCFSKTLAKGRPDVADVEKIESFARELADKIRKMEKIPEPIEVGGNNPPGPYYVPKGEDGKPAVFLKVKPKTSAQKCNQCGICAAACPMGSINKDNPSEVTGICIKCQACILKCPTQAKYFDDPAFLSHKKMVEKNFTRRAEPEFFL